MVIISDIIRQKLQWDRFFSMHSKGFNRCQIILIYLTLFGILFGALPLTETSHYSVVSCLVPACSLHGFAVTTVEGIGSVKNGLHPVQVGNLNNY